MSFSLVVRAGVSPTVTADGNLVLGKRTPDIWAHVRRRWLRVDWEITRWERGEPLAWGRTWTKGGALVEAIRAAHLTDAKAGAR